MKKITITMIVSALLICSNGIMASAKETVAILPCGTSIVTDEIYLCAPGPGGVEEENNYSTGATSENGFPEYIANFAVAEYLKEELESRGYQAVMIRENEQELTTPPENLEKMKQNGADILIEIACRKRQDISERGTMAYAPKEDNMYVGYMASDCIRLSECLLVEFQATGILPTSGIHKSNSYMMINWSNVPATQFLLGCIVDAKDEAVISDSSKWQPMAVGIANGVDLYFGYDKDTASTDDEAALTLEEARDLLHQYLSEEVFTGNSENESNWGEVAGAYGLDGENYYDTYRSYTGAYGTYYINMYNGDVYEKWKAPIAELEEEPLTYTVNLLDWKNE